VDSVARYQGGPVCELLERRRFLDGDPVIVLGEPFQPMDHNNNTDFIELYSPYLWHNPSEQSWNLYDWDSDPNATSQPWTGKSDGNDSNSLADDITGGTSLATVHRTYSQIPPLTARASLAAA
jgi:hypothetical protein